MALQVKDFSVTGTSASRRITYTFTLRLTENTVDPMGNYSNVTVEAILRQSGTGTAFSNWYTGVSCQLNGEQIFSDYTQRTLSGNGEHVFYTWTGDVPHQPDGSGTVRISGRLWQSDYASFSPPAMDIPESEMALVSTPRPSAIYAADTAIGSVSAVGIYTNSPEFTHTVSYRFGDLTGYLTQDGGCSDEPVQLYNTRIYWTVPETFYNEIPTEKWALCTLICTSFYRGTPVGQQQTQFLATASEAACAPSLNPVVSVIDDTTRRLTGGAKGIRYYTSVLCTPGAAAKNGAFLTHVRINGQQVNGAPQTLTQADTETFTFYVRDSRGWEAEAVRTLPMIPYEKPTLRITAHRIAPGSPTVEVTATGSFYVCDFGLQENALQLSCHIDSRNPVSVPVTPAADGSFSVTFTMDEVDYTKASRLTVTAQDRVDSVNARLWVQAGQPVFHWDKDQFTFHVPLQTTSSVAGMYFCQGSGKLQSAFSAWAEAGQLQPVLLFGSGTLGVLTVGSDGAWQWNGSPQLEFTKEKDGCLQLPAGAFSCLSPAPITIKEE